MSPANTIGVDTSSFQSLLTPGRDPVDALVDAVTACGARACELLAPQIEPSFGGRHAGHGSMAGMTPQMMRRELRKWRLRTPPRYFHEIAARFQKAGVAIRAYRYHPDASFTDEEVAYGVKMAKALGASLLTASAGDGVARRFAPAAAEQRMTVAFDGDGALEAIRVSPSFKMVVDAAQLPAGVNAADYVRAHHADVAVLRMGCGTAEGERRQAVSVIEQGGWPIAVFLALDGAAASPVDEMKRCLAALRAG